MNAPLPPARDAAPHVGGLPVLGRALEIQADPYTWWPRMAAQHGPVFRLTLPIPGRTWIALSGLEANRLLATEGHRLFSQARTYPRAPAMLCTPTHPSITEGSLQRHLRRQIAPGLVREAARPQLDGMVAWCQGYVQRWSEGGSFVVTEETSRMGLNCVSLFATGQPLGDDTERIRTYATAFTGVVAIGWPMLLLHWPPFLKTRQWLDAHVEGALAARRADPPGAGRVPDYLDRIDRGTMPDGTPLDERVKVVFGQIPFKNMGVYAGRVLNQVLYQVVKRPDVLARVQPEVDRVMAGGPPTLEDLAGMTALRAAIKETLRVLPIAAAIQRTVVEPFTFGGYRFVDGDRIFLPISATHFDPEAFPDPERFDIDRFIGARPPRHTWNPFGLGNHACMATGLFEVIAQVVVSAALHRWELAAEYELRTMVDALPGPWTGHRMRVVGERRPDVAPVAATRARAAEVSGPVLQAIDAAPVRALAAGEVLFAAGDAATAVFVVEAGTVRHGDAVRGPGETVGAHGAFHGLPHRHAAVAEGPARVRCIPADVLMDAITESDATSAEVAARVLRRAAAQALSARLGGEVVLAGAGGAVEAVPVGTELLTVGAEADRAAVLLDGEALAIGRNGAVLSTMRAPDLFGEVALVQGGTRTATVRAGAEGCRVVWLDRAAFDALLADGAVGPALRALAGERAARV